jgi:hypothetical protein
LQAMRGIVIVTAIATVGMAVAVMMTAAAE